MSQDTLKELFIEQISDIYDAEIQLVDAIPKLADAAEAPELAEALRSHLEETEGHVSRLKAVFEIAGASAKKKTCKGMQGLIAEGDDAVKDQEEGPLRDLAIIAGAQRVEHYEISAYGTARVLAEQLGLEKAVALLQSTEDEESDADANLTSVAMMIYESIDDDADADSEEDAMPTGARVNTSRM